MIVIFDGIDSVGKGTIIKELCEVKKMNIIKATIPPVDCDLQERNRIISDYKAILRVLDQECFRGQINVLDRFHSSEYVYSKVKRNYDASKETLEIERNIINQPHLYIYCHLNLEEHKKRLKDRGDDYIVEEDIIPLSERYDKFFDETKMNKIKIDTNCSPQENAYSILRSIKKYRGEY